MKSFFTEPAYASLEDNPANLLAQHAESAGFDNWIRRNCREHKKPGYMIVNLSLKQMAFPPVILRLNNFGSRCRSYRRI